MRMVDLIEKKKAGLEHSEKEIHFIINGYVEDKIPDYQMSAWMMAICFQGLTQKETTILNMIEDMKNIFIRVLKIHRIE